MGVDYGPRPLKSTGRHGHFLKSTCDIGTPRLGPLDCYRIDTAKRSFRNFDGRMSTCTCK